MGRGGGGGGGRIKGNRCTRKAFQLRIVPERQLIFFSSRSTTTLDTRTSLRRPRSAISCGFAAPLAHAQSPTCQNFLAMFDAPHGGFDSFEAWGFFSLEAMYFELLFEVLTLTFRSTCPFLASWTAFVHACNGGRTRRASKRRP